MKKLYQKSELWFALIWIAVFMLGNSLANGVSARIGVEKSAHAVFTTALAAALYLWIRKNGLTRKYGLCKTTVPAKRFLWYVPLAVIVSHNLWNGAAMKFGWLDLTCYIVYMLGIGFLEEVIFRGLLFRALEKDSVKTAIIISSVTFGLGHLVHLINGSGAGLVENLLQVVGAVAIGFLFVTMFHRGGSLIPCIIAHALYNIASAFSNNAGMTPGMEMLSYAANVAIIVAYTLILWRTLPKKQAAVGS